MKFIYGKQDWADMARGQENCYLLTNGLGGFSSSTMIGSCARNDHALLMACVEAPNHRYNMIHRLEEAFERGGKQVHLSSQEYTDAGQNEEGFRYLSSFSFEDYPRWMYHADGVELVKEMAMAQERNLVAVKYTVENRTAEDVKFIVTPHLQFVPKGRLLEKNQQFVMRERSITSGGLTVGFDTNGTVEPVAGRFVEGLYYGYDACDGRYSKGNTYVNHRVVKEIPARTRGILEIVYRMEAGTVTADDVLAGAASYRRALVKCSGLTNDIARTLVKSANQFISHRKSTDGKTILAGFPFFEDWGRDTMIALAGCGISTGQFETVKSILRTFAAYCKDGLMPNLFPEGQDAPLYNTVDAALLFINAVYLYYKKTGDTEFVKEHWAVMEDIVEHYRRGTDYGIHMDEDGLILAGQKLDQVTWMDVRAGDILPTPRHGKPVEINAYWYNALRVMDALKPCVSGCKALAPEACGRCDYGALARKVKDSFCKKFWNEEKHCLRDVLSGSAADEQIRCNQIWAVSMPFTMLDAQQERQIVDTVFEKLYTPYGLRTLEKNDREFHGSYGGVQLDRDLAYHQGTVWVFPLGAYYLAYLKTQNYSAGAAAKVEQQMEVMERALREGCIGQLPEIYDGENPSFSRGCFAQAWSVGEILRVYEVLEKIQSR